MLLDTGPLVSFLAAGGSLQGEGRTNPCPHRIPIRPLRWPITVSSERWAVKTYARKQDSARSPADRQS